MSADGDSQEITTLVGREIYSSNGVFVGEVEDIQLNLDQESVTALAVTDLNRTLFEDTDIDGRGVLIPYRWVRSVGDVILINDIVERLADSPDDQPEEI